MIPMHERIRQTQAGIWVIANDSHLSRWVEEQGRLDHDRTLDRICDLIPVGGVVIDGGASIGDHTIAYARKVGPTGHVFAFEPNPAPFCCLTMNMAPYPWVHPLRLALGSFPRINRYLLEPENVGMSRMDSSGLATVPVIFDIELREWFKELGRLDFIKLDLEGNELDALVGLRRCLEKFRPSCLVEMNRRFSGNDLIDFFTARNYAVRNFDPTKPDDLSGTQFDLLCTPK